MKVKNLLTDHAGIILNSLRRYVIILEDSISRRVRLDSFQNDRLKT